MNVNRDTLTLANVKPKDEVSVSINKDPTLIILNCKLHYFKLQNQERSQEIRLFI